MGKTYVVSVFLLVVNPGVMTENCTYKQVKIASIMNDQDKNNFAVLEGFWSGFSVNFRNAFNSKYYEQLKEKTFKYK